MDKTLFETRAIAILHERKYVFFEELQQGGEIKRVSDLHFAALIAAGALAGFGAFMFDRSIATDNEIKAELVKLGAVCDLIGVNASSGSVNLVLFVYGDDLTDEAIIGKCHVIHDRLAPFKKFALRIGWNKMPVTAMVFFVFAASEKAFHFRNSVQQHCKHFMMFNKLWVLPWGIDLVSKSVWAYQGLPIKMFNPAEIEKRLFA